MQQEQESRPGVAQGMARCLSMMATHPFEKSKIHLQVHGMATGLCLRGIFQASFTSGLVYATYFGLYESMEDNPWAATLSSLFTSFIKIPLHNSIRVFYIMPTARTIFDCTKAIFRQNGIKGIYTGFRVNVIEDIIETNIRDNLYDRIKHQEKGSWQNVLYGAFCGSLGAALTTPFDTLKSNLVYTASQRYSQLPFTQAILGIYQEKGGLLGLYRGVHLRALSSSLRYTVFYCLLLALERGNQTQTNHNKHGSQNTLPVYAIAKEECC